MGKKPTPKQFNPKLEELAKYLAVNAISTSSHDGDRPEVLNFFLEKEIADEFKATKKRSRNILVIGAGATMNANKKFKNGMGLSGEIKNFLPHDKKDFKKVIEHYSNSHNLKSDTFEAEMYSVSKMGPFHKDKLEEHIKDIFNYPYVTSLFYELVAHMFNHRLFDVIINYNFDEILDGLIDEELTPNKYDKVLPLNSFDRNLLEEDFKRPLYIKPHGTISKPSSLQYTFDDYYSMKEEMEELLKKAFKGEYSNHLIPVNIIIVGFELGSYNAKIIDVIKGEVTRLKETKKSETNKINIYIYNAKSEQDYLKDNENFKKLIDDYKDIVIYKKDHYHEVSKEDQFSLGNEFKDIWNEVVKCYRTENKVRVRNIIRHEVVANIFSNYDLKNDQTYVSDLLHKRLLIELVILIIKSNGLVHINQLKQYRIEKYMRLIISSTRSKIVLRNILLEDLKLGKIEKYIDDVFKVNNDHYKPNGLLNVESYIDSLANSLLNVFHDEMVLDQLKRLEPSNLLTVQENNSSRIISQFYLSGKIKMICSDIEWTYLFDKMMNKSDYDVILTVTERGNIFKNVIPKGKGVKVVVPILAYYNNFTPYSNFDEIASNFNPNFFKIRTREIEGKNNYLNGIAHIPWWIHNSHIVMVCNFVNGELQPQHAIYYKRSMLSNIVSPIYVDSTNKEDLMIIYNIFLNYWAKSFPYPLKNSDINEELFSVKVIFEEEFEKQRQELLIKINSDLTN